MNHQTYRRGEVGSGRGAVGSSQAAALRGCHFERQVESRPAGLGFSTAKTGRLTEAGENCSIGQARAGSAQLGGSHGLVGKVKSVSVTLQTLDVRTD